MENIKYGIDGDDNEEYDLKPTTYLEVRRFFADLRRNLFSPAFLRSPTATLSPSRFKFLALPMSCPKTKQST